MICDITAFGASTSSADNGPAIVAAFEAASNASAGEVYIPPGVWQIESEIAPNLGPAFGLSVRGAGGKTSTIKPARDYDGPGVTLTRNYSHQNIYWDGVSVLCDKWRDDVVSRPYYLKVTSSILPGDPGYGYSNKRNFVARNCVFGGFDLVSPFHGRADAGVIVEHGRWPLLDNVHIDSRGFEDTNEYQNTFLGGHGVHFLNCYYGEFSNGRVHGRFETAIRFTGTMNEAGSHADFEGAIVRNNKLVGFPRRGVMIEHTGRDENALALKEPGFFVQDNHIHAHENGIRMLNHAVANISGNNIATTNDTQFHKPNHNHAYFQDVHSVIVANNLLWGPGYYNGVNDCTRGFVLGQNCNHMSFDGNHHFHRGVGLFNNSAGNFNIKVGPRILIGRDVASKSSVIGPDVFIQNAVGGDITS